MAESNVMVYMSELAIIIHFSCLDTRSFFAVYRKFSRGKLLYAFDAQANDDITSVIHAALFAQSDLQVVAEELIVQSTRCCDAMDGTTKEYTIVDLGPTY